MTDSEMWMECYYGLEVLGDDALAGKGLCYLLDRYWSIDVIDKQLRATFGIYSDEYGYYWPYEYGYYWPAGQSAPRIKACLKLAKLTEGK